MSFPNIWHHRKVADTAARGCEICYKPSSSVLVTPDNKDFFYVCPGHLKEKSFANPIIDQAAIAAKKKKQEMDEELEKVKKEYEEKQRKKKEKEEAEKSKADSKDTDGDAKKDKDEKEPEKKDEVKPSEATESDGTSTPNTDDEPRVFSLQRNFYQQRVNKKRQAEQAKRMREQMKDPSFFPSVPKNLP